MRVVQTDLHGPDDADYGRLGVHPAHLGAPERAQSEGCKNIRIFSQPRPQAKVHQLRHGWIHKQTPLLWGTPRGHQLRLQIEIIVIFKI